MVYTIAMMIKAKARAITPSCVSEKGTVLSTVTVAVTEPAPIRTRSAVPRTSAPSFCASVGCLPIRVLLPVGSLLLSSSIAMNQGYELDERAGKRRGRLLSQSLDGDQPVIWK